MSSPSKFYSLVTLNDRFVPGFAGIMRASMMTGDSPTNRQLKVIVADSSQMSDGKAINFA